METIGFFHPFFLQCPRPPRRQLVCDGRVGRRSAGSAEVGLDPAGHGGAAELQALCRKMIEKLEKNWRNMEKYGRNDDG